MSKQSPGPIQLAPPTRRYEVMTPEGVALEFGLADIGDRIGAFFLDAVLMGLVCLGFWWLLGSLERGDGNDGWLAGAALAALFLVQSFWFIWFELRRGGSTPGKKRAQIRVISAEAGPLTPQMVIARNLMRLLEIWLPVYVLWQPRVLWPDAPGWAQLLAFGWLAGFLLMPLFNRERLRIGDMVAGTRVVRSPPARLLGDVGVLKGREAEQAAAFQFRAEHLSVYGVYELQVLEHLLRQPRDAATRDAMVEVAKRIRRKTKWEGTISRRDVPAFLRAFYKAMRSHQEQRLLMGRRKEHKHASETDAARREAKKG